MAQIWDSAREAFANGDISWLTDTIEVHLIDDTYVFDPTDEVEADITAASLASVVLTGKTNVGGVLDGDNVTFGAVPGGDTVGAVVVLDSTSDKLLVHYDVNASSEPIDVDTTGGDIVVAWSSGPFKMFRI